MSFPANLLPTLGLTGRVGEHQPWDVASNHSQAGGHCTGQDAELMKGSTTWNQTQIFNFLLFFFLNTLILKRRVLLTVPGFRRLYCTTPDARTMALTQASAMWWHSSGTLRMSGCTRPQLNTNTEANINISPQLQLMLQGMQVQTSRFLTPAVF